MLKFSHSLAAITLLSLLLTPAACMHRGLPEGSKPLLTGGTPAKPGELPGVVFFTTPDGGCSGAKIGPRHFLTAAHCVTSGRTDHLAPPYIAGSGFAAVSVTDRVELPPKSERIPLTLVRVTAHPVWLERCPEICEASMKSRPDTPDVAVIEVAEETPAIPVLPVQSAAVEDATTVRIAGYGCETGVAAPGPATRLKYADVRVVPPAEIAGKTAQDPEATRRQYFATPGQALDAAAAGFLCYGDSGGPVLGRTDGGFAVIGVNSHFSFSNAAGETAAVADWHTRLDPGATYDIKAWIDGVVAGTTPASPEPPVVRALRTAVITPPDGTPAGLSPGAAGGALFALRASRPTTYDVTINWPQGTIQGAGAELVFYGMYHGEPQDYALVRPKTGESLISLTVTAQAGGQYFIGTFKGQGPAATLSARPWSAYRQASVSWMTWGSQKHLPYRPAWVPLPAVKGKHLLASLNEWVAGDERAALTALMDASAPRLTLSHQGQIVAEAVATAVFAKSGVSEHGVIFTLPETALASLKTGIDYEAGFRPSAAGSPAWRWGAGPVRLDTVDVDPMPVVGPAKSWTGIIGKDDPVYGPYLPAIPDWLIYVATIDGWEDLAEDGVAAARAFIGAAPQTLVLSAAGYPSLIALISKDPVNIGDARRYGLAFLLPPDSVKAIKPGLRYTITPLEQGEPNRWTIPTGLTVGL